MKYVNFDDGEIRIRPSKREDVDYLKDNLRDEDLQELKYMGVEDIEAALAFGLEAPESTCYTLEFKDKIVLMFGVVSHGDPEKSATLWMLSTDEVKKFRKKFLKLARQYVGMFKKEYNTLLNLIHPSNKLSMKLVSMLRAEFRWGLESPNTGEALVLFLI